MKPYGIKFEDRINDLKGYVYECIAISTADRFLETQKRLQMSGAITSITLEIMLETRLYKWNSPHLTSLMTTYSR